jgi:hypothetical protein
MHVIYINMNPSNHLSCRQDLVKTSYHTHARFSFSWCWKTTNKSSIFWKGFAKKIPLTARRQNHKKTCHKSENIRQETTHWCPDCKVGLCFATYFKEFHTEQFLKVMLNNVELERFQEDILGN